MIARRAVLLGLSAGAVRLAWPENRWEQLKAYNREHGGESLLVIQNNRTLCEDYTSGQDQAYELASGTKSFWGPLALMLKLELDEPMGSVLQEWKDDPRGQITVRQLLSFTSGIPGGSNGSPPTFAEALQTAQTFPAGTRFQYGPNPYQVFGEYVRRKRRMDPLDLLQRHVLGPAQITYKSWRRGSDNQIQLPSGAKFNARNWAQFGQWILKKRADLLPCFQGTRPNAAYGLTWWLNHPVDRTVQTTVGSAMRNILEVAGEPALAGDIWMAAGAGDQRLYLIPSQETVIVRQTDSILRGDSNYSDRDFLVKALV